MNREDIIKLAREAGILETMGYGNPNMKAWQEDVVRELSHFAALVASRVAAAEREACCSGEVLNAANINGGDHPHQVIEKYQAAIRARKENA